jgi:hypothetical protein
MLDIPSSVGIYLSSLSSFLGPAQRASNSAGLGRFALSLSGWKFSPDTLTHSSVWGGLYTHTLGSMGFVFIEYLTLKWGD